MRTLSRGEIRSDNKKVTLYGKFANFWLAQSSRLRIYIFSPKKVSGDCHGSVEVCETLFKTKDLATYSH